MIAKRILIGFLFLNLFFVSYAQENITLPSPPQNGDVSLVEALWERSSTRDQTANPISIEELSDILWAATGINRPESGKLTVPSSMNLQDVSVYVCDNTGTYLYDKRSHSLDKINNKDLRKYVAGPDSKVEIAPTFLVLVSDLSGFGGIDDFNRSMASFDTAYVSQNICLMCAALDIKTVPRMTMEDEILIQELNLNKNQLPMLNHPLSKP